ncbi:MAG: hypothetical protein PVJ57_21780 [Phycisphaerae bacterium]|jgi:hypothetical protein
MASAQQDAGRPQELARTLGLDKNLTWKISKVVQEPNAFAAISHFPGPASVRAFLKAFERAGASSASIQAVRQATADFEHVVRVHSNDRVTLEMMLNNLAADSGRSRMEVHRRSLFRGVSAMWGVQARMQISVHAVVPSEDPDWVDVAWLSGLVDLRRLSRDTPWVITSVGKFADDGTALPVGAVEPLDPAFAAPSVAPLLWDFCSQPLPEVRIDRAGDGITRYVLVEGPIGNVAASTCIIGLLIRAAVRRTRADNYVYGEHGARLYTPTELLVHDLFVHRDLEHALQPQSNVYSQMPGGVVYPACGIDRGLLPAGESLSSLGAPPDVVMTEFPLYRQMIECVFSRQGWDLRQFHGFRLKLRYPPIPALAILRYPLPAVGGGPGEPPKH